jgi:PPP family 3-phenylpropionic acid transporter
MKLSEAWRLRILYFLVFCCTASWLPILADYCKSKGLSGKEISVVLSVTPLMMFLVQPLYGSFADKWGYKKCIVHSSILASVSYLFYLQGSSLIALAGVTIFMSFFYNGIQPLLDSLSLRLSKKDARFSYGSLRIAGAAGWAFTGIVTGQLIDIINLTVIFIIASISMAGVFIFSLGIEDKREEKAVIEESNFSGLRKLLSNYQLLILLLGVFLVSMGGTAIWNFYSIYMKENGASASLVGYGLSFQGLCELPLFYFSARIIARFGVKTTLLITVLATTVRLLLYSITKNPIAAIPIELLHGISWSLFWVVCVEYVNKLVDNQWLATGQSLLYAAYYGIGAIAGNFWTGYLYDNKMKVGDIFLLNAGIVFITAMLFLAFMKSNKAAATSTVA